MSESDPKLRDAALKMAERIADKAFEGRKGHGRGACSYRQMRREELVAFLAAAFERGAEFESRR